MAENFEFPKGLNRFIKRLAFEYERNDMARIAPILTQSKAEMRLETSYDNWDGGQYGHDVVFFVPDGLMGLIPLDMQNEIQARIAQDLNKASSSIGNEFIEAVHFEYAEDESQPEAIVDEQTVGRIWQANTLKLFISHRDTFKHEAHLLADLLLRYGISSFVAHDSIEPDEEWQKEIEKALQSMDVMLAFITDSFFDSAWTNQEIGFAMAKGTPIVSLKLQSQDPIGFIKDRQAIRGDITKPEQAAIPVFETIKKRLQNSAHWRSLVISRFCGSISFEDAKRTSLELYEIVDLSSSEVDQIVKAFNTNSQLNGCWQLNRGTKLVDFLSKYTSSKLKLENERLVLER